MWPWEHLALGYLAYSLSIRLATGDPPRRREAAAVAIGALAPDLIDKPLSWSLDVFPTGYAVAHSVFVAFAVIAAVGTVAADRGHGRVGAAFVVAYVSHLVADICYPVVFGEGPALSRVLWPVATHPGDAVEAGTLQRTILYLVRHLHRLAQPGARRLVALELAFLGTAAALWLLDGTPGLRRGQSPEAPAESSD